MQNDFSPDLAARLLADLQRRMALPHLRYRAPCQTMEGGAENLTVAVDLADRSGAAPGPAVLRRYPRRRDPGGVRLEAAIHTELRAQGYPVPAIFAVCDDPTPIGGAYLLMERLRGRLPLAALGGLHSRGPFRGGSGALRLPALIFEGLWSVPALLANLQLRLHALDAKAVMKAVIRAGVSPHMITARGRIDALVERAAHVPLPGLERALEWLTKNLSEPEPETLCVCHGDFHFLNVLIEPPRVRGVIDWSAQHLCFATPEFEVGNTRALLAVELPGVSGGLRPLVRATQRAMVRRYTRAYARQRSLDERRVVWAEVYRYARELVGVAEQIRAHEGSDLDRPRNPWMQCELRASAIRGIERRCGVRVAFEREDA